MPFRIFANRNRTGAYLIMLFLAAALFTTFYLMAQYLQDVHGWSPFRTGLGFLPMPVTIMFMSLVVVRRLIPTIGIRPFLTVGPILAIVAMVVVLAAHRDEHLLGVPGLHPGARSRHGLQLRAADHDRRQRRRPA